MGLVDFVYPKLCVSCSRSGRYICSECLNKLHLKKFQICPMCTKRSIGGVTHYRCRKSYGLDGLTSIFIYHGVVRKLLGKLKYGLVRDLENDLLELIASFGDFGLIGGKKWTVVEVPLHHSRLMKRGFNQAELMAKMIANYFGWTHERKVLLRDDNTERQTNLKREERLVNVLGAFRAKPRSKELISGNDVLLIDDVWTTGATLRECSKVLKRVGARKVWAMTFAA